MVRSNENETEMEKKKKKCCICTRIYVCFVSFSIYTYIITTFTSRNSFSRGLGPNTWSDSKRPCGTRSISSIEKSVAFKSGGEKIHIITLSPYGYEDAATGCEIPNSQGSDTELFYRYDNAQP